MKFFLDFEATEAKEIVQIGCVALTGEEFCAYVKPNSSTISKFIENLTGISNSFIEQNGLEVEEAFNEFYRFVSKFGSLKYNDFYIYGNGDYSFIKTTANSLKTVKMMSFAAWLNTYMIDYSKDIFKYFNRTVSLIDTYSYVVCKKCTQDHSALEDAKMLMCVYNNTFGKTPSDISVDFLCEADWYVVSDQCGRISKGYIMPSGVFFFKARKQWREIGSCDEAVDYLIKNHIEQRARCTVYRDRIATNIMKAIRKGSTYMGYKWKREK